MTSVKDLAQTLAFWLFEKGSTNTSFRDSTVASATQSK